MIGQTISHYSALWNPAGKRQPASGLAGNPRLLLTVHGGRQARKRDKILEKFDEEHTSPTSLRVGGMLSIPTSLGAGGTGELS